MSRALHLNDIKLHIAEYLRFKHVANCVLVCKDWYLTFAPLLWPKVLVKLNKLSLPFPSLQHLQGSVQHLTFDGLFPNIYLSLCGFRRLYRLTFSGKFLLPPHSTNLWQQITCFIKSNGMSLKELRISTVGSPPLSRFWTVIAQDLNLETLELEHATIYGSDLEAFQKACSTVKCLSLVDVNLQSWGNVKMHNVDRLRVNRARGMDFSDLIKLVKQFHSISELSFDLQLAYQAQDLDAFRNAIAGHSWPELDSLELDVKGNLRFRLEPLLGLLPQPVKKLRLFNFTVLPPSLNMLEQYFPTIVDLEIPQCGVISLEAAIGVLEHCPQLERLSMGKFPSSMISRCGPWGCPKLKHLALEIVLDLSHSHRPSAALGAMGTTAFIFSHRRNYSDELKACKAIFDWIAQAPALEYLDLGPHDKARRLRAQTTMTPLISPWEKYPEISLNAGLASLKNLGKLKYIEVGGYQQIEPADGQWMVDNWRSLETINGSLSDKRSDLQILKAIFDRHDVRILGC